MTLAKQTLGMALMVLGSLTVESTAVATDCVLDPLGLDFTVHPRRSLLVTRVEVLNELVQDPHRYDMGYLLADVGLHRRQLAPPDQDFTAGEFVANIFTQSATEQMFHSTATVDDREAFVGPSLETMQHGHYRIGAPIEGGRRMRVALAQWGGAEAVLDKGNDIQEFMGSPFRLLAVANRMDLAGEFDDRINSFSTAMPRVYGEIHLIYGLVNTDEAWEGADGEGEPYPMTFELTYRIPHDYGYDPSTADWSYFQSIWDLNVDPVTKATTPQWKTRMMLTAEEWMMLSQYRDLNDEGVRDDFTAHLSQLLRPILTPQNFVSLRSNIRVSEDPLEHELREWYVIQNSQTRAQRLVPRKPRREPYRCLDSSPVLEDHVHHYWMPDRNDLDMSTRTLVDYEEDGLRRDHERNGFAIMRDDRRNLGTGPLVDDHLDDYGLWKAPECFTYSAGTGGDLHVDAPFQMVDVDDSAVLLLAPFARVKPYDDLWHMTGLNEKKRHAFAMRTCSGCHSQETGTAGFHIAPRRADEPSPLSSFLTGGATFSYPDRVKRYHYDRLHEDRKDHFQKLLDCEAELYDGLWLADEVSFD